MFFKWEQNCGCKSCFQHSKECTKQILLKFKYKIKKMLRIKNEVIVKNPNKTNTFQIKHCRPPHINELIKAKSELPRIGDDEYNNTKLEQCKSVHITNFVTEQLEESYLDDWIHI